MRTCSFVSLLQNISLCYREVT